MVHQGLPQGILLYEQVHAETGELQAVLDLAWPDGLQKGLSQAVAVVLNEEPETIDLASAAGFRCFRDSERFRRYVEESILSGSLVD